MWKGLAKVSLKLYGVIALLFFALVGVLAYMFKNRFKAKESDEVKNAEDDGHMLSNAGIKPSYSQSWYDDYAKQFFEKYKQYRFITKAKKQDMLYELPRLKNYQDFLQFKKAFAIRSDVGFDYTLPEFIVARFHPDAVSTYNYYVANLLDLVKKKGVKFSA